MIGKLISAKLFHESNGIYWELILADDKDNIIGTFGEKSDAIDFRTFTFGLTKICNCQNLFELTDKPICPSILVKRSATRVESIGNEDGRFFTIDHNAKMSYGFGFDESSYERAELTSLESRSGILTSRIDIGFESQHFQAPEAYRGFKPVYNVDSNIYQQIRGANYFSMFIYQILNVCKIDNLIPHDTTEYPELSVILDNKGKIVALGDVEQQIWLTKSNKGYFLSNSTMQQYTNFSTSRKNNL